MNKSEEKKKTCLGVVLLGAIVLVWVVSGVIAVLIFAPLENEILTQDIFLHLENFQRIADEQGGTRSADSPGYNASVDYVVETLSKFDQYFTVRTQSFTITGWTMTGNPTFSIKTPYEYEFTYKSDFDVFTYSPTVSVNNMLVVDVGLGCSDNDFANVPNTSYVALIQRGDCAFADKNVLAENHGAGAVLIYNNVPGVFRSRAAVGTKIPVFGLSPSIAGIFKSLPATVSLSSSGEDYSLNTLNVIADTKGGDDSRTVVVGSHLDSVPAGPGINDNGSGSAGNLAMALLFAKQNFNNKYKVRFAWWGAEELGLLGSKHYVQDLVQNDPEEYKRIAANLNYDMIGSPNYERAIYNASSGDVVREDIVAGSLMIQKIFEEYFEKHNLRYTLTPFTGRSDYGPFIEEGICASGLASGAEEIKTEEQRIEFGGVANAQLDPCYHQYCDTINNIDKNIITQNTNAALYVLKKLVTDSELINSIYNSNDRTAQSEKRFLDL